MNLKNLEVVEQAPLTVALVPFTHHFPYTGREIAPLWALKTFGIQGDSIIVFRGPLSVLESELVDVKDLVFEGGKGRPVISSKDAISFIIEHFDQQPPSLRLMYHRLRIIAFLFKELAEEKCGLRLQRDGTDTYFNGGKLNVGVATVSPGSGKIHFAINISVEGAPPGIKVASLLDLGVSEGEVESFAVSLAKRYRREILDVEGDVAKSKTF
ncbi:MAG: DUF366 family protein [Candidatus Freyarchaeota archaeon]|nr:DUF366 family protein [Candidatus Freyrarchaeum guaymaensis]